MMRPLTTLELILIAGGSGGSVVVDGGGGPPAWYYYDEPGGNGNPNGDSGDNGSGGGGGDGGSPSDSDSIDVDIKATTPLTGPEQAAVDAFKTAIANVLLKLNTLYDGQTLTLPNGQKVTVGDLREIISKVDVEIVDNNHYFRNESGRGEADWNGGDPIIRLTVQNLVNYHFSGSGSMEYLFLHEVGHMTIPQRAGLTSAYADGNYSETERAAHERGANDIAKAFANATGIAIFANPGDGYSSGAFNFSSPPVALDWIYAVNAYVPFVDGLPATNMGVLVSNGVDFGSMTHADFMGRFSLFWSQYEVNNAYPGFEQYRQSSFAWAHSLQPYFGLTGQAAVDYLASHPLTFTTAQNAIVNMII